MAKISISTGFTKKASLEILDGILSAYELLDKAIEFVEVAIIYPYGQPLLGKVPFQMKIVVFDPYSNYSDNKKCTREVHGRFPEDVNCKELVSGEFLREFSKFMDEQTSSHEYRRREFAEKVQPIIVGSAFKEATSAGTTGSKTT